MIGTYYETPVFIAGVLTLPCNVLAKKEVQALVLAFKPHLVIYCVGMASLHECSLKEKLAERLNTSGVFNVVESCQRFKSLVCYFSSHFVFSGKSEKYLEIDTLDPNTIYGKTQVATEYYFQKAALKYLIFRVAKLYGHGCTLKRWTWFETLQRKLAKRQTLLCDTQVKQGFLDIYYLAMVIKICFERGIENRLFQVSSRDFMSHYEFAGIYCSLFPQEEKLLLKATRPLPLMKNAPCVERPSYCLETGNVENFLDITIPTVRESLEFSYKRLSERGA